MNQLNNRINLDRAVGAEENISTGEEKMRNSSKKTPWHLRFAPGAILRKKAIIAIIAVVAMLTQAPVEKAEAFTLIDLMNAIRQAQELASTNSASTNSPPAYQPQDGDKIAYVTTSLWGKQPIGFFIGKLIRRWTGGGAGSVAGNVIYDASKGAWVNSPSAQAPSGQVWARAHIGISGVSGEQAYWYSVSGKPISRTLINANNYNESQERDYYYHFAYYKLQWNDDDERNLGTETKL